ncbi:MAG: LptF/LptG family permease, partial [Coxiellaceae bacterium]|nr:LptF/LptG family permease [Coxiellaceae bacterium]
GVWLRKDNSYIKINSVSASNTMMGVQRFDFDSDNKLKRVAFALTGKQTKEGWTLYNISETLFEGGKVSAKSVPSEPLGIDFQPKLLKQVKEDVDHESVFSLFHNILYREKTGLVTSQYQYAFWKRIIQPITTIVMICLGIPFIFGSLRSASMGFRIMTGVIIGFGFYMLNQFFGPITLVYQFPPLLAATLPTVLFVIAYAILVGRITK